MGKLHVSAYSGHLQVLTTISLKEFYIICLNPATYKFIDPIILPNLA